ncbi:MAG: hypothetical protein Q8O01_02860 [Candidatus Omnitrophota bacterium]|nr:hypothetical protein [Candidatus Omnitrophota bacterium]
MRSEVIEKPKIYGKIKPGQLKKGRPSRHGGYTFLTRAEIPERRSYLRAYLSEAREGLIRDLGPMEADLSTAQKILIDRIITKLAVLRLIEESCHDNGVFDKGEIVPALGNNYLAFDNSIRLSLQALGIQKKTEGRILDLSEYIRAHDEQKARETGEISDEGIKEGPNSCVNGAVDHDLKEGR